MTDKKKLPIGFPMGIKVNADELINGLTIEELIKMTQVYHGNTYIVGYDTLYVTKPHYHIHWFSVKETTEGAMKTFRSNVIKKKYPHITRSFRFYTGQDLPTAQKQNWLAYCIKEKLIEVNNIEVNETMLIEAKAHLEIKRLKKIKSEQKADAEKEKMEFKDEMFAYVEKNMLDYQSVGEQCYGNEQMAFEIACIQFLVMKKKCGSMKIHFLNQYYLEYKALHSQEKWSPYQIYQYIHNK